MAAADREVGLLLAAGCYCHKRWWIWKL